MIICKVADKCPASKVCTHAVPHEIKFQSGENICMKHNCRVVKEYEGCTEQEA